MNIPRLIRLALAEVFMLSGLRVVREKKMGSTGRAQKERCPARLAIWLPRLQPRAISRQHPDPLSWL